MATHPKRTRRLPWRPTLVVLVTTIGTLLLAETAHRVWRRASGWPYDEVATRELFVQSRSYASQPTPMPANANPNVEYRSEHGVLDPYVGFDTDAADGALDAELTAAKTRREDEYKIVVLGGSVAYILTNVSAATLVQTVNSDPRFQKLDVRLSNHARGGYKQPQQINEFVFLLTLGLRPSAVINIDGFNEVALGNDNAQTGFHPLYPSHGHWLHLTGLGPTDRESTDLLATMRGKRQHAVRLADLGLELGLWNSSVAGTLIRRRLRGSLSAAGDAQLAYSKRLFDSLADRNMAGPALHGDDDGLAIAVEGWAQASLCIQALCSARGIPYLHVLQPTLHDEGAKPVTEAELKTGFVLPTWMDGVRSGYPMLRERGARLRSEGVAFVDASRIFADVHATLYYDACHFGKAGNELLARFVARAFLDSLPSSPR